MDRLRTAQNEAAQILQRKKDLATIDNGLHSILSAILVPTYPGPMKAELCRRLGETLLPVLPTSVTEVDLGVIKISRPADHIERVQPDLRQSWDMRRVDEYGAQLAQGLGVNYNPKFLPES